MAQFNVPKSPAKTILSISDFKGVDLYNSPTNVDDSRSPDAPNMIRDVPGKVRKRMGYRQIKKYPDCINGIFSMNGRYLIHSGNKLYELMESDYEDTEELGKVIYEGMNGVRSDAWQVNEKLYILDGKTFLVYGEFENTSEDGTTAKAFRVKPVAEDAYIPTVIISRNPEGGGTTLEPINLLQRKWKESFLGKADIKIYQLTSGELDDTKVTARKKNASGTWVDMTEGTDFTVDRTNGKVTFTTAPGAPPVAGQDNVEITASKLRGESVKETERFSGTAGTKEYQLLAKNISNDAVTARILQEDGAWNTLSESSGFSIDRQTGKVEFLTAPGESPDPDKKNIEIQYTVIKSYVDRINRCSISTLFGVNGSADRLFVSGNPDYPNRDWYSQMNDPSYFGDLWYSVLGQDNSAVMGYSIINDRLAVHKDESEDGRNVILRQGALIDSKPAFPITGTLQGKGALGKYTFDYLSTEPLFLTRLGIMTITAADMTGEKYSQNRSFYINKALMEEPNLQNAYGFAYRDFYMLAVNSRVYVLDGLQKTYERNTPYSTFQYECYYWENINAHILWERNGALCFGTRDGYIMEFYTDPEDRNSYTDNGAAIPAHWDIPDVDGKLFYKNKTFRRMDVRLASAAVTGIKAWVQKRGQWYLLFSDFSKARFFTFDQLSYGDFTFSTDNTPKTLGTKIKVKKVDKARYRLENNEPDQPFGVYSIALEYTENGNYKG